MTEEQKIKEKITHYRTWQGRFFTSLILITGATVGLLLRGLNTTLEKTLFSLGIIVFFIHIFILIRIEIKITGWLK
jgi:hypothetical protein